MKTRIGRFVNSVAEVVRLTGAVLAAALAALLVLPASGLAAGGPPPGRGHGTGEETTLGNNLSVPAIFVPGSTASGAPVLRVPCGSTPQAPVGPTSAQFPGYWLQGTEATWSATCQEATSVTGIVADWGDNLTTSPKLAAGKPIRVEVGLLDAAATGLTGYVVDNLTPELEDRLATYGTAGTSFVTGTAGAPQTRVWDAGTTLTIQPLDQAGQPVGQPVYSGPISAEINSTGAVVYGYNWGSQGRSNTPSAGTYRLTFTTAMNTTITGVADTGVVNVPTYDAHSTSVTVTLTSSTSGGRRGGGRDDGR